MDINDKWEQFTKTGKVNDYIEYKQQMLNSNNNYDNKYECISNKRTNSRGE